MKKSKENLRVLLKELSSINGGSGQEQSVIKSVVEKITPHADEVKIDQNGNVIAIKKGHKNGPSLMLAAHTDEIGLVVKNILDNGFLLVDKVGGVPDNLMLGRKVSVGPNNVQGIIGTKPGHLQTAEEARRVKGVTECYVDLALPSREAVEKAGVKIGDQVIWDSDFTEMTDSDFISTKAVDDRVNCSVIIELFRNLEASDFAGTLYGVFTVREEVGLYGAHTVGHAYPTDYALVLDTIPAGDTPDVNTELELPIYLGKGPGLPISDAVGITFFSYIHPAVRKIIEKHASQEGINLQTCTINSGGYTTDSAKLAYAGDGIPTATIAVPRRYSHSPVELMNINDAVDVLNLVTAIVKDNKSADLSFI